MGRILGETKEECWIELYEETRKDIEENIVKELGRNLRGSGKKELKE